jgi:hypothetical protein
MSFHIPWRQTADRIILARLQDIFAADAIASLPMMYRSRHRNESMQATYFERHNALVAMGWRDLSQAQRVVLIAICRDGMSLVGIAEASGLSHATICRVRARALDKIYLALADDDLLARVGPVTRRSTMPNPRGPAGYIPFDLRVSVYRRDGFACLHCGTRQALSIDHIHPFSKGGTTVYENLQTLCRPCNSRKGAKVLDVGGLQSGVVVK